MPKLPFPSNYFDLVSVAFGLRNMTHKEGALARCCACSSRAANCWCWSFPRWGPLKPAYDLYSFKALPLMGKLVAI